MTIYKCHRCNAVMDTEREPLEPYRASADTLGCCSECGVAITEQNEIYLHHLQEAFDAVNIVRAKNLTGVDLDEPNALKQMTDERGKNYGKPIDHFNASQAMYDVWENRFGTDPRVMNEEHIRAVKHGVRFIIDKCVRAAENPMHKDNWDDIQGYAWCIKNALEMED